MRELRNAVQRSAIFAFQSNSDKIKLEHLPDSMMDDRNIVITQNTSDEKLELLDLEGAVERLEKEMIQHALLVSNNSMAKAAKILQIPRTTLYYKLEKYKLGK